MNLGLIIDIGLGALVLLSAIVGVIKGFSKQFTSSLRKFIALCGAIALVALVSAPLRNAEFYKSMVNGAAGWFKNDLYTTVVSSSEDLKTALGNSSLKFLAALSDPIYNAMSQANAQTLGLFLGRAIVNIISSFILWLAFYLVLKFMLLGIYKLLRKASDLPVLNTIDRIFGLLWAVVLSYIVIIVFTLTTIQMILRTFAPDFYGTFQNVISQTTVLKALDDYNIIGKLILEFVLGSKA